MKIQPKNLCYRIQTLALKKASNWLLARVKRQFLINGDTEDPYCWKLLMTYAEQSEAEDFRV
jgi:hypothetical protein